MSDPFVGEIRLFGFNFPPRGWAQCDGQLLAIASNSALFSLLGTIYGGDGRTTFGLPDLRGRAALHYGTGPGLASKAIGQRGGSETNTLNQLNLPPHSHVVTATARCKGTAGNANDAVGNVWADDLGSASATYSNLAPDSNMSTNAIDTTCSNTGNGQAVNNMQPFQVVNYGIALVGVFPSRS